MSFPPPCYSRQSQPASENIPPYPAPELAPPGFEDKSWDARGSPRVHVRNTFIEVDEEAHDLTLSGLDLHNAPQRTWRRGHLRCASEPMSFFLSPPLWEPMTLSTMPSGGPLRSADSRTNAALDRSNTAHRSLNQSFFSATIRESLEEYDESLKHSSPKYVQTGGSARAWCGEPMLVDVGRSASPAEEKVPTLQMPPRCSKHARQRSRTIQEDSELDSQKVEGVPGVTEFWGSWDSRGVRVRNTFIEVDEGSDGCTDPVLPTWRPTGHLRCASEPIPSFGERIHSSLHSRSSSYQEDEQIIGSHQDSPPYPSHEAAGHILPHSNVVGCSEQSLQRGLQVPFPSSEDHLTQRSQVTLSEHAAFDHGPIGSSANKAPACKWHIRGSCKYGASWLCLRCFIL